MAAYIRKQWIVATAAVWWAAAANTSLGESPTSVSVCEIMADPAAFNHKFLKIRGSVTRGFEGFTLKDKRCPGQTIWLEFGGDKGAEVVYCCGVPIDPIRPESLVLEGIETKIKRNRVLARFDSITKRRHKYGKAVATMIGHYFSGEKQTFPGGTFWVGFGHMGFYSLFVIEEVESVSRE